MKKVQQLNVMLDDVSWKSLFPVNHEDDSDELPPEEQTL